MFTVGVFSAVFLTLGIIIILMTVDSNIGVKNEDRKDECKTLTDDFGYFDNWICPEDDD